VKSQKSKVGLRRLRESQGVPGSDLCTAAAPAQQIERLLQGEAALHGLRGFLAPADFRAKTLEAERPRPLDLRVVGVAPEAIARFTRLACGAQHLFRRSGFRARPIRPSIVECKLSCHWSLQNCPGRRKATVTDSV
jgi:hypothetical protein